VARVDGGLTRFLADGPVAHPRFAVLARELNGLAMLPGAEPDAVRPVLDRIRQYFVTLSGKPRKRFTPYRSDHCVSAAAWRRHSAAAKGIAPAVAEALAAFDRDLNVVLARGAQRMFAIAVTEYERELAARSVLDFSDVLQRALDLLRRMDEFAQSRYRLESRYHHVLVDEFQDTSRAQWELVSLLIESWGEGFGLVHDAPVPPSVFVVGDRKQSIYGFRDADVAVLHDAAAYIDMLRPDGNARRSISHSFRAVPPLLAFINDLFAAVDKAERPRDGFRYDPSDRFPVDLSAATTPLPAGAGPPSPLGLVLGETVEDSARRVAGEVERLIAGATVRDRSSGLARQATPGDIAILFRSRETHREFQAALESRAIPAYVYKGLGFFDADEVKDYRALLRYLANPASELRTAALLRSRLVGITDGSLARLAGRLSVTLQSHDPPADLETVDPGDRAILLRLRSSVPGWVAAVDRMAPAELLDQVSADCAYAFELRGPRLPQARENLKKMRGLVRRLQNRGFATMSRIADHVDRLSGDVSNAVVDAFDAVNLMTVHAAKGLEFPVVFLVELARGTGGGAPAIRVVADRGDGEPSVSVAPFRSEADQDQRPRDQEETKRLLYVATTRARDRLYLAATLTDGVVKVGAGSFAAVMPGSLLAALAAPADPHRLTWSGPERRHTLSLVGAPETPTPPPVAARATEAIADRFEPWRPLGGPPRLAVTAISAAAPVTAVRQDADGSDPVVGRLVHRMLQRDGERGDAGSALTDPIDPSLRAIEQMTAEERARPDYRQTAAAATAIHRRAVERPDVAALLSGDCLFEVPFSMRRDDVTDDGVVIVRGAIDCLHRSTDGRLTVIEFKTGPAQPGHEHQLTFYTDAASALFPDAAVDGMLLYV
jgi:ATP-dependent exoDNAse (exonuclease V) beta subunit